MSVVEEKYDILKKSGRKRKKFLDTSVKKLFILAIVITTFYYVLVEITNYFSIVK